MTECVIYSREYLSVIASSNSKSKCGKLTVMQEKASFMGVWYRQKNPSLGITVRHHSESLVKLISDPRDIFFYAHQHHILLFFHTGEGYPRVLPGPTILI